MLRRVLRCGRLLDTRTGRRTHGIEWRAGVPPHLPRDSLTAQHADAATALEGVRGCDPDAKTEFGFGTPFSLVVANAVGAPAIAVDPYLGRLAPARLLQAVVRWHVRRLAMGRGQYHRSTPSLEPARSRWRCSKLSQQATEITSLAVRWQPQHYDVMPVSITFRNVPNEVRGELSARAARSGMSLQEYLLARLADLAAKPDPADVIARARERVRPTGVGLATERILEALAADRR